MQETFPHKLYAQIAAMHGFISIENLCTTGTYFAITGESRQDLIEKPGTWEYHAACCSLNDTLPVPDATPLHWHDSTTFRIAPGQNPTGGDHNSHGNDSFSPDKRVLIVHLSQQRQQPTHLFFVYTYMYRYRSSTERERLHCF
jgi:hypothetical protein